MKQRPRLFIIDNYDSFTYNLVHLALQAEVPLVCKRNDQFELDEIASFTHILLSPGPGIPEDAGLMMEVIARYQHTHSIFGVCLGMQALLIHAGSAMINMPTVKHGAQEKIQILGDSTILNRTPDGFNAGLYHSWGFKPEAVNSNYRVCAMSGDGYVMAVEHEKLPLYGVQFHPESIMTEHGLTMMKNWLNG